MKSKAAWIERWRKEFCGLFVQLTHPARVKNNRQRYKKSRTVLLKKRIGRKTSHAVWPAKLLGASLALFRINTWHQDSFLSIAGYSGRVKMKRLFLFFLVKSFSRDLVFQLYQKWATNPNRSTVISYVCCCEYDWSRNWMTDGSKREGPIRLSFLLVNHPGCLDRDLIYPSAGTRAVKTHRAMHHTVNEIWSTANFFPGRPDGRGSHKHIIRLACRWARISITIHVVVYQLQSATPCCVSSSSF